MAEKKRNLGGRPKGARDVKPRKRRGKDTPDPWKKKTRKGRPGSQTNRKLLLDHLRKYDFDVVQEILWMYDQLKGQCEIVKSEDGVEMTVYPKEVTQQMLEILKLLVSHSFPKMKALELSTSDDKPITLNFNLGGQQAPKKIEAVVEEEKEQAIEMISGPGGIHIPLPDKKKIQEV